MTRRTFDNDDHSRFAGPTYMDRVSLSYPKNYQRTDTRIYEDICEALLNDRHVDATDIEIEVTDGIVTLRGSVENRFMKREAGHCAESIPGVKDVFNMIILPEFKDNGSEGLIKNQANLS